MLIIDDAGIGGFGFSGPMNVIVSSLRNLMPLLEMLWSSEAGYDGIYDYSMSTSDG